MVLGSLKKQAGQAVGRSQEAAPWFSAYPQECISQAFSKLLWVMVLTTATESTTSGEPNVESQKELMLTVESPVYETTGLPHQGRLALPRLDGAFSL